MDIPSPGAGADRPNARRRLRRGRGWGPNQIVIPRCQRRARTVPNRRLQRVRSRSVAPGSVSLPPVSRDQAAWRCVAWFGRPMSAVRIGAWVVVLAVGTGCGGQGELDAGALSQQAKALQSVAAEGALLAHDAASGKSTGVYRASIPPSFVEPRLRSRRHWRRPRRHRHSIQSGVGWWRWGRRSPRTSIASATRRDPRIVRLAATGRGCSADRERLAGRLREHEECPCRRAGLLSAIGGFVDIGDLVFNTQAGAMFGFQLIWVVVVGVVGIIVYSEMCGRVSAVASGRYSTSSAREPGSVLD